MNYLELIEEVIFKKIEKDESNNVFTNYNNFTRDEHVFKETLKQCMYFLEDIIEERDRYRKGMQEYYGELMKIKNENKKVFTK